MLVKLKELLHHPITYLLGIYLLLEGLSYLFDLLNKSYWQVELAGNTLGVSLIYLTQTLTILAAILFIKRVQGFSWQELGFRKVFFLQSAGYVIFAYLAYFFVTFNLVLFFEEQGLKVPGFSRQESYINIFGDDYFGLITLGVAALLIAPLVEELLFRGYLLENLKKKWGTLLASLLTALFFALFHFQFESFFFLFFLGLLLNWVYLKSNSIWPCLGFHILNNVLALIVEMVVFN